MSQVSGNIRDWRMLEGIEIKGQPDLNKRTATCPIQKQIKCLVSWVTQDPKFLPTTQCQVGLYFLSNSFLMQAAMSFSMLNFSRATLAQSMASCCISSFMSACLITAFRQAVDIINLIQQNPINFAAYLSLRLFIRLNYRNTPVLVEVYSMFGCAALQLLRFSGSLLDVCEAAGLAEDQRLSHFQALKKILRLQPSSCWIQ